METNRIRQFCALVECGNLRKAAELMHISHGGLSKSMKTLQDELGFALLQPSGRGLVVTDQGMEFYQRAKSLLPELESLQRLGAQETRPFRIGSFEVFSTYFIPKMIREITRSELRDREIELHELLPGKMEQALLDRKIDLALTYEPIPAAGITVMRVGTIAMSAFCKRGMHRAEREHLGFVAPLFPLEGAPSGNKGLDGFPDERVPRKILYRVDMLQSALQLVSEGLAAGFFPVFLAKLYNQSVRAEAQIEAFDYPKLSKRVTRGAYLMYREGTVESSEFRWVAKSLRALE